MYNNYRIALLMALVFIGSNGFSQTFQYGWNYYQDAGNPNGINTESDAPGQNAWIDIFTGGTSTNVWSDNVAIPFTFEYFGTVVTDLKASTNGLVTFDTASTLLPSTTSLLPSAAVASQTIAGFWDEFTNAPPVGTSDDIRYKVIGTAPDRQLWIKWYSFEMGNPAIGFGYWAVVLEETTNNIYIVDQYSSSDDDATLNLNASVGVQNSLTEFTQAGGGFVDFSGNGSALDDNDYYEFFLMDSLNVELVEIAEPSGSLCPGTYDVELAVRNVGYTTITSLDIDISVNGAPPTTVPFTGLNIAPNEFDTLSIGSQTFAAGLFYDFDIYATLVNGIQDNDQTNDSIIIVDARTGLLGNYTIDDSSPTAGTNYASFAEAALDLNDWGVCGAVVFDVAAGTYQDSVYLNEIEGASATNTITFDGGDANDVTLTYDGAFVEAVWQMDGTDHVIIKNITIENTKSTSDAWNIHLSNGADSNTIDSCRFLLPVASTTDVQHIVASNSLTFETSSGNNANYLTVSNSYFRGGETGIHIEGNGTNAWTNGYYVHNNTFRQLDDEAFDCDDIQDIELIGNDVDSITTSGADGFYLLDVNDYRIEENYIHVNDWGIYIIDGNDGVTPAQNSTVINNMVISDTDDGVYLNDFENTNVFHNTFKGTPGLSINDQINIDLRNNIIVGDGAVSFDSWDALTPSDVVDYNVYGRIDAGDLVDVGGTLHIDLAAWQAASAGYNVNALEGVPLFAGLYDLHVLDTLANDVGDNSTNVLVDIDGDARPAATTVDIGADEFTPISNDISVIQILSPTGTLCEDSLQFVQVVIQNAGLNEQDTIPFVLEMIEGTTTTWLDTLYPVLGSFVVDTILLGPINTFGYTAAQLNVIANAGLDEVASNDTVSDSLFVNPLPVAITPTNDVLCTNADTATLSVIGTLDEIRWYETEFADSIAFIGDTLVSPTPGPVSYWVAQVAKTTGLVGAPYDTIGATSNFTSVTAQYMEFEVESSITLDSLTVYPNDTGTLEIFLQDNNGNNLDTVTTTVQPASANAAVRIAVGFEIEPGNYRLAAGAATNTGGLIRNSNGANYPYTIPSAISITGNSFGPSYYYFFYNWQVSYFGCEGLRTEVMGYIDTTYVQLPPDQTICPDNDEIINPLEIGFTYTSYLWSDGSTDTVYVANDAETVSVTVTSIYGCEHSDDIILDTHALDPISIGNDTSFCEGEEFEVTFTATNGFVQYFWSTAAQTQSITVDYPATFTVSVTDNNGCEQTSSAVISIDPLPIANGGPDTLICDDEVYTLPIIGGGLTGSWTDAGGNPVTEADAAGEYYLTVTDVNGCSSMDTIMVTTQDCDTSGTGVMVINGQTVGVYPNPTMGEVNVSFNAPVSAVNLTIYDALGNLIIQDLDRAGQNFRLDLSSLAKGYYMLQVEQGEQRALQRIILQ
jgi:hypothetical protein